MPASMPKNFPKQIWEHWIDTIEECLICLTDVATDSLRRSIEDEEFEIGSTKAANSLTLLGGL